MGSRPSTARAVWTQPSQESRAPAGPQRADTPRQPALGLAGILLVAPVAIVLGVGAGGLEPSLRILGPLSTFGLPIVAMIAFWWHDWPGSRFDAPLSALLNIGLVLVGAVLLTLVAQRVVGHLDLNGVFRTNPGVGKSPTFPATMPLGAAFFVVMLQVTLVCERWPFDSLGLRSSGPIALLVAWGIALTLYLVLVRTPPRAADGLYSRAGGTFSGPEFAAILTAVGLWQVWFYVVLRGWPFARIAARGPRLLLGNLAILAAGAVTYLALHGGARLTPQTVSAIAGCLLTAALLHGMLFDGLPQRRAHPGGERLIALAAVALMAAILYSALTALAHQARWTVATPQEWVTYAGLNAIGLGVILHVGIGRRWPFVVSGDDSVTRPPR